MMLVLIVLRHPFSVLVADGSGIIKLRYLYSALSKKKYNNVLEGEHVKCGEIMKQGEGNKERQSIFFCVLSSFVIACILYPFEYTLVLYSSIFSWVLSSFIVVYSRGYSRPL